jgi:hypothetical protein
MTILCIQNALHSDTSTLDRGGRPSFLATMIAGPQYNLLLPPGQYQPKVCVFDTIRVFQAFRTCASYH